MARKFEVEGTKSFLIWFVILLLLGLWCVKDGWFPSADVLAKHPYVDNPSEGIERDNGYYLFNRVLATLSLLGAVVCGYIHRVVK